MSRRHQPKHAPKVPFALLVVGMIVGAMCALLALNTASAANELGRHNLAVQDASIAAQVQQLENQVAASAAPGALANAAAALGMVPAGNPAFLQVGVNGAVQVLGSPAPASGQPPLVKPVAANVALAATKAARAAKKTRTSGSAGRATKPPSAPPSTIAGPRTPTATPIATPTPTTTLPGGTR